MSFSFIVNPFPLSNQAYTDRLRLQWEQTNGTFGSFFGSTQRGEQTEKGEHKAKRVFHGLPWKWSNFLFESPDASLKKPFSTCLVSGQKKERVFECVLRAHSRKSFVFNSAKLNRCSQNGGVAVISFYVFSNLFLLIY